MPFGSLIHNIALYWPAKLQTLWHSWELRMIISRR